MRSNFPSARRHLEEAHRLLAGEDELSLKSRQAIEILIDAFLATEFSGGDSRAKIIDLAEARLRRREPEGERASPVA